MGVNLRAKKPHLLSSMYAFSIIQSRMRRKVLRAVGCWGSKRHSAYQWAELLHAGRAQNYDMRKKNVIPAVWILLQCGKVVYAAQAQVILTYEFTIVEGAWRYVALVVCTLSSKDLRCSYRVWQWKERDLCN